MSILRYTIIFSIVFIFTSCESVANNMTGTGLIVLSVILLAIFGFTFYSIFKKTRQANKSLAKFSASIQAMLDKADTPEQRIKSLDILIKRIKEDERYKKDTSWQNKVLSRTYLFLATQYFEIGDTNKTLQTCTEILKLDPDDAMTLYNRGSIYLNTGEYVKALADLNKSIELVEDYASSYNNRGMIFSNLEKYEEAIEDFTTALQMEESAITYYNRGMAYHKLKNMEQANSNYDKALELNKDDDEDLEQEILVAKDKLSAI